MIPHTENGVTSHCCPPKKTKRHIDTYMNMSVKSRADVSRNHNSLIKNDGVTVTVNHKICTYIYMGTDVNKTASSRAHASKSREKHQFLPGSSYFGGENMDIGIVFGFC